MKIIYRETLVHQFDIDAHTKEDAMKKFLKLVNEGEIDFSYGEIVDTETIVKS